MDRPGDGRVKTAKPLILPCRVASAPVEIGSKCRCCPAAQVQDDNGTYMYGYPLPLVQGAVSCLKGSSVVIMRGIKYLSNR